jgi:ABC-type branched-subunit amino acid transport system substrate-binding protein
MAMLTRATAAFLMAAAMLVATGVVASAPSGAVSAPIVVEVIYSNPPPSASSAGAIPTPEILSGSQAAAKAIDANGGVDGRKINIVGCNFQNNPNQAAACGRQAGTDKAAAVIGECFYSSNLDPVLQQEGIPYFVFAQLPQDYAESNTFPLGPGAEGVLISDVALLVKENHPHVGVAYADISSLTSQVQLFLKYAASGLKSPSGVKSTSAGEVPIPLTATDLTPTIEAMHSKGANGVILIQLGSGLAAGANAVKQLGLDMDLAETADGYNNSQFKQLPNGFLLTDLTPPPQTATNLPGIKEFRADMKKANNAGVANAGPAYYDGESLLGWLSVYAIDQTIPHVKGAVSPASLMTALKGIKTMDVQGLLTLHPSLQGHGPAGLKNLIDGDIYYEKVENGVPVLVQSTPVDFTKVLNQAATGNFPPGG